MCAQLPAPQCLETDALPPWGWDRCLSARSRGARQTASDQGVASVQGGAGAPTGRFGFRRDLGSLSEWKTNHTRRLQTG